MEHITQAIGEYIRNFDWNSSQAIWVAALGMAFLFQRWMIFFFIVLIMVLGDNIEKVLVFDYTFNNYTVTAPFVVYAVGGVVVFVMAFLSLFRT